MKNVRQSPTDPGFVQDPYPFYDALRAQGPFVNWQDYEMPVSAHHNVVAALLRDKRFGREQPSDLRAPIPAHLQPFHDIEDNSMLELEPPRHTRLRSLVLRAFTSRRIAALEPEIIELCHDLIDQFPNEEFDLLSHFAQQLPVIVIARLLGVPEDKSDQLLAWSNAMVAMYQAKRTARDEARAVEATQAFVAYLTDYITQRRADPKDNLISALIAAEEDGETLTRGELISTCILLLNAGHEATVHTLGNAVKTMLETGLRPFDDPAAFAEEALRHDPPLHMFTRYAMVDVAVFGHHFKRGDQVGLLLGAANRDPAAYPDPAAFDVTRRKPVHTSFGGGIHFCVGAPLARMEIALAIPILFQRCPNLSLAEAPKYANLYHFHGLERLMVTR